LTDKVKWQSNYLAN